MIHSVLTFSRLHSTDLETFISMATFKIQDHPGFQKLLKAEIKDKERCPCPRCGDKHSDHHILDCPVTPDNAWGHPSILKQLKLDQMTDEIRKELEKLFLELPRPKSKQAVQEAYKKVTHVRSEERRVGKECPV